MKLRGRWPALAALGLAALVCGCFAVRPARYLDEMAAGDRAHSAGRMLEAAAAYDRAAHEAARRADRDEALYLAGQAYRRAGDTDTALARFDWLAEHAVAWGRDARGPLEAARIRLGLGQRQRAEADLLALAVRLPETGPARRAVGLILIERDADDPRGESALAWIDAVFPTLGETILGAALLYERAQRLERLGRDLEAAESYARLMARTYPYNPRWDDGGLAYARLLARVGQHREALGVIARTLSYREAASLPPGSSSRPHFGELQLLRATILRDGLRDAAAAADAFHALYTEHPTSRLRDDALWEEATLREGLTQHARACDVYATLAREFPCTRFGRRGLELARRCGVAGPLGDDRECHHPPRVRAGTDDAPATP